jgi:hypothetical protein
MFTVFLTYRFDKQGVFNNKIIVVERLKLIEKDSPGSSVKNLLIKIHICHLNTQAKPYN